MIYDLEVPLPINLRIYSIFASVNLLLFSFLGIFPESFSDLIFKEAVKCG